MRRCAGLVMLGLLFTALAPAARAQIAWRGFVEYALSTRVQSTSLGNLVLNEGRLELNGDYYGENTAAFFSVDFLADRVIEDEAIEIREAYGRVDLFSGSAELRAGRQPATWGTGDLLFINDLFPKDWVSFFAGRSDQYLKVPVDAVRVNVYPGDVTLDVVWMPTFTPDRLPDGSRFVLDLPGTPLLVEPRPKNLGDSELAARVSVPRGTWTLEGYGYFGAWKSPSGVRVDPMTQSPAAMYYPDLSVYGASARGTLRGGVAWVEGGYYDSREFGGDAVVPPSQTMVLAGYERTWWSDGTLSAQGLFTHRESGDERDRWLVAFRGRQLLASQTVQLSLFAFYSPDDEDGHVRASMTYDIEDGVSVTVGSHIFGGPVGTTFGTVADNDLVFGRLRINF